MEETMTRRNSKDSVFVKLFQDKKNVLRLYQELHPEAVDVTEDSITIETLHSLLVNGLFNDLGFTVNNQYILLVEAQSAWSPNITLRMLLYLTESYKHIIDQTRQSTHSSKRIDLPVPEMYLIYSGPRQVPDRLSLRQDYFGGKGDLDLAVRVLHTADQTIYGQYVGFCRIFDRNRRIYGNSLECAKTTVEQAITQDCLSEFLLNYRSEVITMMEQLFDEDVARKIFVESETKHLIEENRAEARKEGITEGIQQGKAIGLTEGKAIGLTEGILKTALNMLHAGIFSKENIAVATGLPMETINELAAQGV
jgi:hypothetical protein